MFTRCRMRSPPDTHAIGRTLDGVTFTPGGFALPYGRGAEPEKRLFLGRYHAPRISSCSACSA